MKRTAPVDAATVALVRRLYASGEARKLRLDARLSLADVATPAGLAAETIWKLETSRRTPRADTAMLLAPVLNSLIELEAGL